jgi:hypothetical protein
MLDCYKEARRIPIVGVTQSNGGLKPRKAR